MINGSESNHAIVFGASGLLGWSVVHQLLSAYPRPGSFSKVTAVMNRQVSEADLCWPAASPNRPRLQIVHGVNLLQGTADDLAKQLRDKADEAERITHAFYFVFAPFNDDHIRECNQNCDIMRRVANAMNIVTPRLESFVYPGGTRGYGIYTPHGTFTPPLVESMADNLPEDYVQTVAYPWFRRILTKASDGYDWKWTEVCPDTVVGFSPNGSAFSLALHWAQYLSLFAYNHGIRGADSSTVSRVEVPFPGNDAGYHSIHTPVSEITLGRISIYAALNPEQCGGKVINMMDNDMPTSYSEMWPAIAAWFGLVGVGPSDDNNTLKPSEYIAKYRHLFTDNQLPKAVKCGVGLGSSQLDSVGWWLGFDRQLSPDRLRACGYTEQRDPNGGWLDAFQKFRDAGIIF